VRRGVELADIGVPGFFEDGGGLVLAAGTVQVTELRAAQRQAGLSGPRRRFMLIILRLVTKSNRNKNELD
jgi:hypothetical protein